MDWNIVLMILGVLILLDGLVLIINPKWVSKVTIKFLKKVKNVVLLGILELIIAIVLIIIGMRVS